MKKCVMASQHPLPAYTTPFLAIKGVKRFCVYSLSVVDVIGYCTFLHHSKTMHAMRSGSAFLLHIYYRCLKEIWVVGVERNGIRKCACLQPLPRDCLFSGVCWAGGYLHLDSL